MKTVLRLVLTMGIGMVSTLTLLWLLGGNLHAVHAATRDVCPTCTFTTIQAAVNAATSGDVISVTAGTYTETINITKSLTLAGAGQSNTILYPPTSDVGLPGDRVFTATQMIVIAASGVTIHDLTLDGNNPTISGTVTVNGVDIDARNGIITDYNLGAWNDLDVHDVTVKNIYLRGIYARPLNGQVLHGLRFYRNRVQNVAGEWDNSVAILARGSEGALLTDNVVVDVVRGVGCFVDSDCLVQNNVITNATESGIYVAWNLNTMTPTVVTSNTIVGGYMGVESYYNAVPATITLNTIRNAENGIDLGAQSSNTLVAQNWIEGGGVITSTGVRVWTDGHGDTSLATAATVQGNTLLSNGIGIAVIADPALTATVGVYGNLISGSLQSGVVLTGSGILSVTLGGAPAQANVFRNNAILNLELVNTGWDVPATFNDWGVTVLSDIESLIYHKADNPSLGQVIYYGFTANASPTNVAVDGASVAVISGTLTGLYTPAGNVVSFTTSFGNLSAPSSAAGASGVATVTLSSSSVGTATITATPSLIGAVPLSATVSVRFLGADVAITKTVAPTLPRVEPGDWTEYAGNPVFDPTTNRAYYPTVIYDAAAFGHAQGDVISASLPYTYQVTPYYEMWVATGAGGAGIQFAYSGDGVNWHEFNGGAALPGLYSSGYHSFVLYDAGGFGTSYRYKVWYWSGIMGYSVGDIRTADSVDGIVWENDQALTQDGAMPIVTGLGVGWNRGSYGPNHVIYDAGGSATLDDGSLWNNRYVMYYNGTDGSQEYVGLGYSTDGKHWKRYGDDPILLLGASGEWDSYSISYVSLVRKNATEWHLWYSGSQTNGTNEGIGYASSSDGIHWTKSAGHIFHKSDGVAWRNDRTYTPVTLYSAANFDGHGDTSPYKMWFTGRSSGGNYAIGCARTDEVTFGSLLRPGDALTYTLTYVNNGPGPATSVTVMDRLSPGIKRTGSTSSPDHEPPTGADPVWVWSIGTLDAGQGGVITLSAVVDMNVAWGQLTTITNWVTITTATVEDNTANNVYSATQRVIPGEPYTVTLTPVPATIALTGTSSVTATVTDRWGNPVSDGTTITFTANSLGTIPTSQPRVTVNGVATSTFQAGLVAGAAIVTGTTTTAVGAASITVTPDLPYTLTLQANPTMLMANGASTSAITATVVDQFGNPVADNTSVSFSATLGSVSTPHLTKDGRAVATFTAGALAGTATVTATTNGRSSSVNLVLTQGLIDLSQSFKRASAAVVASTESLTYTIILTNSGNSVATNVVLTDPIPLGVTFVPSSLSGDGATYNASQNRIEWSGTLQPGGSVRFTYAITVSTVQVITVTNKANVSLDNVLDRVLIAEARVTPRYLYLPLVMRSFP